MIQIYSREICPLCKVVKDQLTFYKIPFVEYVVDKDFSRQQVKERFPYFNQLPIVVTESGEFSGQEVPKMINEYKEHFGKTLLNENANT